jgi:hypothetical protein
MLSAASTTESHETHLLQQRQSRIIVQNRTITGHSNAQVGARQRGGKKLQEIRFRQGTTSHMRKRTSHQKHTGTNESNTDETAIFMPDIAVKKRVTPEVQCWTRGMRRKNRILTWSTTSLLLPRPHMQLLLLPPLPLRACYHRSQTPKSNPLWKSCRFLPEPHLPPPTLPVPRTAAAEHACARRADDPECRVRL